MTSDYRDDLPAGDEEIVSAFMHRLGAAALGDHPRLPAADVLYLKGRLIRRWNDERRVRRPIELMEPIEIAAGVAAAILLLVWSVPSAFSWLSPMIF